MKRRDEKKSSAKGSQGAHIEITESPDYKAVYASGVFGGLDPHDGRIIFFLDRIKPKMKGDTKGAMELGKIDRELQVEVHLPPAQFASIARWMIEHVQRFEKRIKSGKMEGKAPETSGTSYIG
jgi:hypothetical protein